MRVRTGGANAMTYSAPSGYTQSVQGPRLLEQWVCISTVDTGTFSTLSVGLESSMAVRC